MDSFSNNGDFIARSIFFGFPACRGGVVAYRRSREAAGPVHARRSGGETAAQVGFKCLPGQHSWFRLFGDRAWLHREAALWCTMCRALGSELKPFFKADSRLFSLYEK
jgi:hypothetical protein